MGAFDDLIPVESKQDNPFGDLIPRDDEREMRRTDLAQQMMQARIEREGGEATESALGGAESITERLTPAGILNQPARAFGYADPFQPGVPVVDLPEPSEEWIRGIGRMGGMAIPEGVAKVASGIGKLGVRTLEGLTTPESLLTLPATAARLGQALFAGQMAQHLPESIGQAGEVLRDPNQPLSEKIAAGGQPLVQAGMLRLAGRTPEWLPSERPKVPVKPVEAPVEAPSERPESFKIERPLEIEQKPAEVSVDPPPKEVPLAPITEIPAEPIKVSEIPTAPKEFPPGTSIHEMEQSLGHLVKDKILNAPSFSKLLASAKSFQKSLGKNLRPDWEEWIKESPWDLLSEHAGVMNAKSARAKTLRSLSDAVIREAGLPMEKPGNYRGMEYRVDWDKVNQSQIPSKSEATQTGTSTETQGGTAGAFPAPPMPPIPSAAPPTVTPKAISQVIRDMSKGLGVPMRFGRLTTPKFGGYFKPRPNLIGAKYANDMPVIGHEAGHNIDTTFGFSGTPALRAELNILGDPATAGSMSSWTKSKSGAYKMGEGVAEFVRYWLIDPEHAATVAPNVSRAFETTLNSNPDFGRVMRQAQEDIRLWRTAEPEARLQSSISTSDPNNARYNLSDLTRDAVDDLHYLRLAVDDAKKAGSNIPPSKDPYLNARLLRGSYGMADTFIRKGIVDFKTKDVRLGTGLEQILKPVAGRVNEFRRWIVAKQAQELHRAGKQTGLTPSDVDFVANKYDADPVFNDTFTKFKQWNDALLQYAVDGGLISPESAAGMRKMNADYVPFHRVFEIGAGEKPSMESVGTGSGLNVGKPGSLRGRSGSRRDIVDPLETVIKNAYAVITATEKNAINTALGDMLEMKGMGKWGDRVAAPKEAVKIESERIRSQLEALGADMSMVPDDAVVQFFRQSGRPVFGENIIKVNRGGDSQYYRLRKELFDTFHALDMDAGGTLIKILSQPAQLLRAGVTLTPDFATFNAIRDTVSSAVISKYGGTPFYTTLKGLGNLLRNPQLASEWAAAGGKQAVEASYFDRAKLQKFLADKIVKDKSLGQQMAMWAKSPLTALRTFTGLLEEGTRLGQYQLAYDKLIKDGMAPGEARRLAAFEARDLQDFGKGGSKTKPVRMMTAFWNALLQANVRLASSFKNRPVQTALKGLAFVTVPKLIEQSINWNDPDYWDRPQWERDLFFLLPYGKDANGHTKFFRIPTPFEIGLIFGTFPGRVLEWAKNNKPEAVKDFPADFARQAIPYQMVPQWVTTMLELNAGKQGYSFFRGKPIVPTSVADKPPELQFTTQNSLTARKLGGLLKMSPAKIDYAINGLTGGLGKQAVHQIADRAISAVTGEERTAKGVAPFGRFVATPAAIQSQAIEDFYEKLGEAEQDFERAKAGMATTGMRDYLQSFRAHARTLSEYRKRIREERDETKRNELAYQMRLVAERALKQIKKD